MGLLASAAPIDASGRRHEATLVSNQENTEFRGRVIGGPAEAFLAGRQGLAQTGVEAGEVLIGRGKFVELSMHAEGVYEIVADPPGYRARTMTVAPPHSRRLSFTFQKSDRDGASQELRLELSDERRPRLTIESPSGTTVSNPWITLIINGHAGAGISALRITVNGDPVLDPARESPRGRELSGSYRIPLIEGENLVHASLRDREENVGSSALSIYRRGPADRPADPEAPPPQPSGRLYGSGYERRVGVVIGINRYAYWPPLEGAAGDARRMASTLKEIGFDRVFELYDADASRQGILKLISEDVRNSVGPEDLVLIFFAGHGETETLPRDRKQGYIVPVDASVDGVFSTAISMEALRGLAQRLEAKHIYYAMDSCYSGLGFTRGVSTRPAAQDYFSKITSFPVVQMITAGMEGERAIERAGQGLFTSVLVRALEGEADLNRDGFVTAGEVASFVRPEVTAASSNRQTPLAGTLSGSGEVVLVLP